MTTVGLELTSFIDPSLTWKTVSKGRNTSRRSRRPASKNMKMIQEHDKRSPKGLHSESEKSNVLLCGRRLSGNKNMEHIPIKKRRLFFRSPSPPLQSNPQEESEGLVGCHYTSNQLTCSNFTTENQVRGINFSKGVESKSNFDVKIDEISVKSSNEARGSMEDFSGIAILAAAACSDRLDNSTDDAVKSQGQMDGILDKEPNESSVSASDKIKYIANIQSPDVLGKNIGHVEGFSAVDSSKVSIRVVRVNTDADVVGTSPMNEFQKVEENDTVAASPAKKESVECLVLSDSLRTDAVHVNKESIGDFQNDVAHKASANSGVTRDFRFHWDLNTVMDEWDEPIDDTDIGSSTQLVEIAPLNNMDSQKLEDVEGSGAKMQNSEEVKGLEAKISEATVSGGNDTYQAEVFEEPESVALPDKADFTLIRPAFSRMEHCSVESSGFVTSILKENISPSNANNHLVESSVCVTDSRIQFEVVNEDANIDHSLSLGLNGTKALASEEINGGACSGYPNEVPEETSHFAMQTVSEVNKDVFLLAPLSGKTFLEVEDADCKHIEDSKVSNVLDENDKELANLTFQSAIAQSCGSSKCENAALIASESDEVSCRVNDLHLKNSEPPKQISLVDGEVKHQEIVGQPLDALPSSSEIKVEKESSFSLCASQVDGVTTSMSMNNDQAIDGVIASEVGENPTVIDASETDLTNVNGSEACVIDMLDHGVAVGASSKPTSGHHLGGVYGSHVSNENSSQVTATVTELEGGYDSHLEDGELREPHCWEDNEGEDMETEHVDYDSDNRDGGFFYEAANDDSVQLSGEVLVGECEKQSYRSDNFSSADDQPNLDKNVEENRSLQFQGCFSTVDAKEVCARRESSALKACSAPNNSDKGEMDTKDCRSSIEADSAVKEFDNDPPRNTQGASARGRDLQFSDGKCIDSISRSSIHHTDGPDDSLTRSQQAKMRMGWFGGRSWNPDMKNNVANSASEDDGERILRASGDTSPFRGCRPRIINTSRSGFHFVRRGSSGERDIDNGMGMLKTRDISPDNNPRNRLARFNGINRGFREGYRRPGAYEGLKSGGGPILNRFGKRERSFSPVGDRFHRKTRSRSRTHSPDFRSEARIGRGRLPYQQANHAGEHARERSSPVRVFNQNQRFDAICSTGRMRSDDCMRPTMRPMRFHDTTTSGRGHDFEESDDYRRKSLLMRNRRRSRSRSRSRSPDFRPDVRIGSMRVPYQHSGDHVRGRRSPPVRVFRPDQRFEGGGSPPARLRSDECLRPMLRPLRFQETAQPGRGPDFNNNNSSNGDDFRRKPRNIFERIHPGRHYDVEGDVRRFQYENEESTLHSQNFRRNENYGRAGERRPVEFRGPRDERGNVRYSNNNSDRMFYSGPKQFGGIRDYADDGLPRRVRQ